MDFCFENQRSGIGCVQSFSYEGSKRNWEAVKCIRVDNNGEYKGPFEEYCKSHGIRLKKTMPMTSQHNGVA